jgi:hypothetical protein
MRMDWIRNATGPGTESTYQNGKYSISFNIEYLFQLELYSRYHSYEVTCDVGPPFGSYYPQANADLCHRDCLWLSFKRYK